MEGEVDFDPTTEEGQADINDEDETTPLIDSNDVSRNRNIRDIAQRHLRYHERTSRILDRAGEEIEMQGMGRTELKMQIINDLQEKFPDMDPARLDVQAGDKGQIQVKYSGRDKWYNLFQRKDPSKLNSGLTKEIKDALGKANLSERMKENTEDLDELNRKIKTITEKMPEGAAAENRIKELEENLEEMQRQYVKLQNELKTAGQEDRIVLTREANKALRERDNFKQQLDAAINGLGISSVEVDNLQASIDRSMEEREELLKEINTKEEQLSQKDQAIEDLEYEIDRQRDIINDQESTEEEREAAKKELETIREEVAELQGQREKIKKELGLTTKEKIKRALLKYGLPLAFAVAVSSVVGVILTSLKGVGNGVKKLGKGLTDMGKRMAASIPGLLGSVIGFALRAGGELLKFVGNNIWILVVAIGVVLMKKLK